MKTKLSREVVTTGSFTASQVRSLLAGVPDDARVNVSKLSGDPREYGSVTQTTLTCRWEEDLAEATRPSSDKL